MLIIIHIKTFALKSKDFEIISFKLVLKFFVVLTLGLCTETIAVIQIYSKNVCR